MRELSVKGQNDAYRIIIDDSFDRLGTILSELYSSDVRVCIVTDSNVGRLYLNEVLKKLEESFDTVVSFTFPAGEGSKNLDTVQKVYRFLLDRHFHRKDVIVALGGGVTGDLAGYAAATYMRGIDYVQVPTTLLSQVDSSIGGKTGVDFDGYKNIVGAFKKPRLVFTNPSTLKTLPKRQFVSGMAEVIKHGYILDREYLTYLKKHRAEIMSLQEDVLEEMIEVSCKIKRDVVEQDFTEQSVRALLNFGHTVGHAVEKFAYERLFHGECVAIGMVAATILSVRKGLSEPSLLTDVRETLKSFELPVSVGGLQEKSIVDALYLDKKAEGNSIKWILLNEAGHAVIYRDITREEAAEAVHEILE